MPDDQAPQHSPQRCPSLTLANSIGSNILAKAKREVSVQSSKPGCSVPNYLISGLASLGCSPQEISTLTKIPQDKLPKDLINQGKAKLQHALRRAQIKAALKGNPALLIWLGKALLNQRDQPDSQTSQHTNIVVTSDLLKNLQHSYHNTIADFRNSRNNLDSQGAQLASSNPFSHDIYSNPNPERKPALTTLEYVPRGTSSDTPIQDSESEREVARDVAHAQCDEAQHVATQGVSDQEQGSDTPITLETGPPGVPPPTRTPTPTPKRLISRGLGKSKSGEKVTKWAEYSVGQVAGRWSGTLKKLKGASKTSDPACARGGSRKEDSPAQATSNEVGACREGS